MNNEIVQIEMHPVPDPDNPPDPVQEGPAAPPADPTWADFQHAPDDQRWLIFGTMMAKSDSRAIAADERAIAADERARVADERNAALANRVIQLETAAKEKEKEDSARVTASKVWATLAEEFDWVRKDVFDKTRGFPTSKNPSPKMFIPLELENSWLEEPPCSGKDTHGYYPVDTKFPTTEKHLVPKDSTDTEAGSLKTGRTRCLSSSTILRPKSFFWPIL